MFNKEEYDNFKETLESITEIDTKELTINAWLDRIFTFLIYLKDFKWLKTYVNPKEFVDDYYRHLPFYALKDKTGATMDINEIFYEAFKTNGYLFHITKTDNVPSILKDGLMTLNKKTNKNMYIECNEINACWERVRKRNNLRDLSTLISVPCYNKLYENRFNSIYLTLQLDDALEEYGHASELFYQYIDSLLIQTEQYIEPYQFFKENKNPKEEIIRQLKNKLEISDNEINCLFALFDTCYENLGSYCDGNITGKAIIMVPQEKIISENIRSESYFRLLRQEKLFYKNLRTCFDIEYYGNIDNQDLITVSIEKEQDTNKVNLKVRKIET